MSIVIPVLNVPRAELDRLGYAGKEPGEIADDLILTENRIELMVLRKHLPDVFEEKDLVELMRAAPEAQYLKVRRPAPKADTVRQMTIVEAINGLTRLTCKVRHFSKDPADIEALHKVLRETSVWWPGYGSVMAEARINLLLAGQVIKDNFPNIVAGFPGLNQFGIDTVKRTLAQLEGMDSEGNIPERMAGTYTSQEFWLSVISKVKKEQAMWYEMYNIDVERKKNPGKVLVGKQWMEYGSVFFDAHQTEMVVINHQTLPKQTLETKAQGMENILAAMPLEHAQPAIDLINELGGNMFAAICRGGLQRINHVVNECHTASVNASTGKSTDGSGIEVREQ
jgi:hypothetical protein